MWADGEPDTLETAGSAIPAADIAAATIGERADALMQERERRIAEAYATLVRAGMAGFADGMVPTWGVECLMDARSYAEARRAYGLRAGREARDSLAAKGTFEQFVFQFGLARRYCGADPAVRRAFAAEVTRAFPTLSEDQAMTLMEDLSLDTLRYCREVPGLMGYTSFSEAAENLPDGYEPVLAEIGFQILRRVASGWYDIPRIAEEMRSLGGLTMAAK